MRKLDMALMLLLMGLAACISFDLDDRRYRCGTDSSLCGEGMTCSASGYCEPAADVGDAGQADAPAGELGGDEVCDDGVDDDGDMAIDCADPDCDNLSCGIGCQCQRRLPTENACGDGQDNDDDSFTDCRDTDCPSCTGGLMCCSDGACRLSC